MNEILFKAILAVIDASEEVMFQYKNGFESENKSDNSPLTSADKAAHLILTNKLEQFNFPILSEEGNHLSHTERMKWEKYWIIDPIDGTREFINKTGEFCICVALVENKKSKLGIIAAPAKNHFYFGSLDLGAFKLNFDFDKWNKYKIAKNLNQIIENSYPIPKNYTNKEYTILSSKNFKDNKTNAYISDKKNTYPNLKEISCGSAIKFGLIAEGKADEYTRLSPLSFWDIAAGEAIIKSAGLKIVSSETNQEILYTDPNMQIMGFHAFSNPALL